MPVPIFHIPFIFASIFLLIGIIGNYDWDHPALFLGFAVTTLGVLMYTLGFVQGIMNVMSGVGPGYHPIKTEFLAIVALVGGGCVISVPVAGAFSIIELFFSEKTDTPVPDIVTTKREKVATTADNTKAKEQLKLRLLTMSETELQTELKTAIEKEWYDRAGLIRDALERFR